jgi:hypothetical protein
MSIRLTSTRAKVLASGALIAAAAGAAGLATFGSFTSTTSANAQVNSGTVTINLGTAGTAANRLTVAASNIVPGDTIQRAVTLSNSGNAGLATLSLTTAATTSSLLDTNTSDGLQMLVEDCPSAWTEAGTAPAYTYTCTAGATTVVASRAVIGANIPLTGLAALNAGGTDNLRVTLTFPATAGNNMQNQSSVIGFTFTGTQRGATNK